MTNLFDKLKSDGGFSVNAAYDAPAGGYMVSLVDMETVVPLDELTEAHFENIQENYMSALGEYSSEYFGLLYFGAWYNESDGNVYFDISENLANYYDAVKAGAERSQLAIWNVEQAEAVYL